MFRATIPGLQGWVFEVTRGASGAVLLQHYTGDNRMRGLGESPSLSREGAHSLAVCLRQAAGAGESDPLAYSVPATTELARQLAAVEHRLAFFDTPTLRHHYVALIAELQAEQRRLSAALVRAGRDQA